MTFTDRTMERRLAWSLVLAIGLTRIPGLAGGYLPDASLAAFFIGGLYLTRPRSFGWLLAAAFIADFMAFRFGSVSAACVTPAYLFLVPTYGVVWGAGRSSRRAMLGDQRWLARAALYVMGAVVAAFMLSNAGYYVFAPDTAAIGVLDYAATVSGYFPTYASEALVYVVPVLLAARWREHLRRGAPAAA